MADDAHELTLDTCRCGRGEEIGLLSVYANRVLFRVVTPGTHTASHEGVTDLCCLDCAADAIATVANGEARARLRAKAAEHRQAVLALTVPPATEEPR